MNDFRFPDSPNQELRRHLCSAMLGGFIAGSGYMAIGLTLEFLPTPPVFPPPGRGLSYGQQAILLMGVACGMGAMCGWGGSLVLQSRSALGCCVASIGFAVALYVAALLWTDQRGRYGVDRSEWILYPPLILVGMVLWLLVGTMVILSFLRPRNKAVLHDV
jgi:hypothetical protein